MAGPVKAYAWAQGTTAAIVGPTRSRGWRFYQCVHGC